jgi:cell division protein FtsB
MFKRVPKFLRNRYAATILALVLYISFFDAHDLISQLGTRYKLHQIQAQVEYLEKDTESARAQIIDLTTNKASLEKFAREQYRMKRENEEIFVILTEE